VGTIGLPESLQVFDSLCKTIFKGEDEDPNVKAMAVWSLGRIASPEIAPRSKKVLVHALKDSYWKVRAAACTAVAQMGEPVAQVTLPILTKILKEGQINRQTVAETIIAVGQLGES